MDKIKEDLIKKIKESGNSSEFDKTFPLKWCSGVGDNDIEFDFEKFNIDIKNVDAEQMCFLLGYTKIAWCQNCLEIDENKDDETDINLKNRKQFLQINI